MSASSSQPLAGDSPKDKTSKPWDCDGSYQYPLPAPEGDPWDSLLKPLLENDTVKCNAWVDEVQNLLIFAGLFSAVVTAFAVEAYKGLQEDPVVALLAQIAANSARNGSTEAPFTFTPGAPAIRLNIFLFLSLILSLSSVLIGIVALQWIREHRQLGNSLTPQNKFATLHMRTEALDKWHVPQIFASLPLLLQFALVFFFAGIIQLLIDASTIVLIPVACVMGVTVLFLVSTTILPTIQAVTLNYSRLMLNDNIPVPCPYKSPQAQAFRRFVTSSKTLFKATSFFFGAVYWIILHLVLFPRQLRSWTYCANAIELARSSFTRTSTYVSMLFGTLWRWTLLLARTLLNADYIHEWHGFDYMRPHIFKYWCQQSWLEFDIAWMSVRDNYFESILPQDTRLFMNRESNITSGALYDAVQGLYNELTKNNFNNRVNPEPAIAVAYHCAMSLCFPPVDNLQDLEDTGFTNPLLSRNHYLAIFLSYRGVTPLQPFSTTLQPSDFKLLWEETSFIFLSFIYEEFNTISISPIVTSHFAEVYLRLLNQLYSRPYEMDCDPQSVLLPDMAFEADELYLMEVCNGPDQPFTCQWALSITAFFRVLGDHTTQYSKICRSFHAHPFFRGYSANFWRQLKYEIHTRTVREDTIHEVINTLSIIDGMLDKCLENQEPEDGEDTVHSRSQFVFHTVAIHLYLFRYWNVNHHDLAANVELTIDKLRDVKSRLHSLGVEIKISPERGINNDSHNVTDRIPWFTTAWWTKVFPEFAESIRGRSTVIRQNTINASSTISFNGEYRVETSSQ